MSLRLRAVLIAGISLVFLWGAAAAWMMQGVRADLDKTLDGRLAMSARMVAGLLEGGALTPGQPSPDLAEAVRVDAGARISCVIRGLHGQVLARTTGGPALSAVSTPTGFSMHEEQGSLWRVYVLNSGGYQITTADSIDQRDVLVNELLHAVGVPFLIAILGGLAALWIGIGRGLVPLQNLCLQLRTKQTDDTTPIAVTRSPSELRPVLDAMNGLLGRLAQAISSQRAFTDAAAHELRTPLTVIDTHLQVVRVTKGVEAESSLRSAEEGVQRLRRTLDQMMILARTEASTGGQDGGCASILSAVNQVLSQVDNDARPRLALCVTGADLATSIPKSMLEAAVRNLVENAIRYSPDRMPVEITIVFDEYSDHCRIAVADHGPGLTEEQVLQIGRRFWRGDQGRQSKNGAGLGISIVHAIVVRFGGRLKLGHRKGGGLVAEISIPCGKTANPVVQQKSI